VTLRIPGGLLFEIIAKEVSKVFGKTLRVSVRYYIEPELKEEALGGVVRAVDCTLNLLLVSLYLP